MLVFIQSMIQVEFSYSMVLSLFWCFVFFHSYVIYLVFRVFSFLRDLSCISSVFFLT